MPSKILYLYFRITKWISISTCCAGVQRKQTHTIVCYQGKHFYHFVKSPVHVKSPSFWQRHPRSHIYRFLLPWSESVRQPFTPLPIPPPQKHSLSSRMLSYTGGNTIATVKKIAKKQDRKIHYSDRSWKGHKKVNKVESISIYKHYFFHDFICNLLYVATIKIANLLLQNDFYLFDFYNKKKLLLYTDW